MRTAGSAAIARDRRSYAHVEGRPIRVNLLGDADGVGVVRRRKDDFEGDAPAANQRAAVSQSGLQGGAAALMRQQRAESLLKRAWERGRAASKRRRPS